MTRTELLKIAKPILFNTDMVRAIQDGRKTVTRRVVKPSNKRYFIDKTLSGKPAEFQMISIDEAKFIRMAKPQYKVNDILYVRETWVKLDNEIMYKADDEIPEGWHLTGWKPSIHMPKVSARIFLKVTDVRVERLQDITIDGCKSEGIYDDYKTTSEKYHTALIERAYPIVFSKLWNSTIKKQDLDKYGWDANPWVWVYEFERINNNENNNN